jgi:GntR family transcriptional regulator / MocR family aminotransferase
MEPIFDLAVSLPARGSRRLLRSLHAQLKAAILDGRLKPGLRLPATRALASTLGISRNTAVAAYELLLSEGYLTGRPGAGTHVAALPSPARRSKRGGGSANNHRLAAAWRGARPITAFAARPPFRHDFRLGLPDTALFPFALWRRLSGRALRALSRQPAIYAEAEGRAALREAIARHVSFTRAVACEAGDIVVTSGAQQAFDLLARILVTPARTAVALEDPGYPPLRSAFAAAGANLHSVPVDAEGIDTDRLPRSARVICVTPSHQFPLGIAMSQQRRLRLLDVARARDAVIIEDDYDGEYRFGGRPLDALQTLDRADCVFYVGTFSKSLFPALRLGYVVAPPWARSALIAAKQTSDWHSTVLAQDTLAAFTQEGHLARHVRKMRRIYGERRAALLDALERHCASWLTPIPAMAGLHIAARLRKGIDAPALARKASEKGIGVETLDRYATRQLAVNGLAFGYGTIAAAEIDDAIRRLARLKA